jgi:hypothetical protein
MLFILIGNMEAFGEDRPIMERIMGLDGKSPLRFPRWWNDLFTALAFRRYFYTKKISLTERVKKINCGINFPFRQRRSEVEKWPTLNDRGGFTLKQLNHIST